MDTGKKCNLGALSTAIGYESATLHRCDKPNEHWAKFMDRITTALLEDFSREHDIGGPDESERFEHFAGYITLRRHFSGTFDTADIVTGGGDTGTDSISILVNGTLVADVDDFTSRSIPPNCGTRSAFPRLRRTLNETKWIV